MPAPTLVVANKQPHPQHYAARCIPQHANWCPSSCGQAMALQKFAMDASWCSGGYDKADFAAILGAAFCISNKFLLLCGLCACSPVIFCRTNPGSNAADDRSSACSSWFLCPRRDTIYVLGADRGDCQSGKKDSGTESHGEYLVIIGLGNSLRGI
jgi:hypothetical protein